MFKTTSFLALSVSLSVSSLACSSTEIRHEPGQVAPEPEPTAAPGALQTAHNAYLAGDYIGTTEAIRDVLVDPASGALAKENALELLDSTYEATNGNLPTRFTLPSEITGISIGGQRGISKYAVWRSMFLWMRVKEGVGAKVDEFALLRADGTPLLAKDGPNTRFRVKHVEPGFDDVVINLDKLDELPADGVYTLRIGVGGRRLVDTWLITRHIEATTAPVLTAPGEQVTDPNPIVKFEPFHSPEGAPFERRSVSVYVEDSSAKIEKFNFWTPSRDGLKQVRIDKPLAPGSYWVSVTAQERRFFGPIQIERAAQTGAPFTVSR